MDKFKNKDGSLTEYALACGYIQQVEKDGIRVTLWEEGSQLYHVKMHNFNKHERVFWECSEDLNEMKQLYNKTVEGMV